MEITVIRGGMLTTIQDLGRTGHRAAGVPLSGAMDACALRVANLLVGNPEATAVLECTLLGPELAFSTDTVIALGGADFAGVESWRPIMMRAGERVKLGAARTGCRGYLAVAGGFDVPAVLGSRSTYLRAGFGGFLGRALRDGDVLAAADVTRHVVNHWRIDRRILPVYSAAPVVRVVRGAQLDDFGAALFEAEFKVLTQSDRMGVRLGGAKLARIGAVELISSAVAPGTVQVPAVAGGGVEAAAALHQRHHAGALQPGRRPAHHSHGRRPDDRWLSAGRTRDLRGFAAGGAAPTGRSTQVHRSPAG